MPAFLKHKLQNEYGKDSSIPYKVMNKIGAMKGNKETAKGKAMEKKHEMAKKLNRVHGFRHLSSQMKSLAGGKWGKKLNTDHDNKLWEYARENRMSDKRIF